MHEFIDKYPELNKPNIYIAYTKLKTVTNFRMNNVVNGAVQESNLVYIYHLRYSPELVIGEIF